MINLVHNARWDIFLYVRTQSATTPHDTQVSCEPEKPKGPRMVIISIPPWDLSRLDLKDFVTPGTVSM